MYVDDTHITHASTDVHSLQSSNIHKWLLCNKLTLIYSEYDYTKFMLIGSRQKLSTLSESFELSIDNFGL